MTYSPSAGASELTETGHRQDEPDEASSSSGGSASPLRLIYICKAVDTDATYVATQVRWITALADSPSVEHIHVLTPNVGRADLPTNVTVSDLGGPHGKPAPPRSRRLLRAVGLLRFVFRFYRRLFTARPWRFDAAVVVQGGPYPALLLPVRLLLRMPVYHWKAHPHVSRRMRFYARVCDDLVLTATPSSLPFPSAKVRPIGHGIETDRFVRSPEYPSRDLVTVGRISPVKRIDQMLRAIAEIRRRYGVAYELDVIGSTSTANRPYRDQLRSLAAELDVQDQVRFLGEMPHERVAELLPTYAAFLNFSATAFDKAAGEAMAAGVPVISTNECTREVFPTELESALFVAPSDTTRQAEAINEIMKWGAAQRRCAGSLLRSHIHENHSLATLPSRWTREMLAHLNGSS